LVPPAARAGKLSLQCGTNSSGVRKKLTFTSTLNVNLIKTIAVALSVREGSIKKMHLTMR
jgi:hypothetical protein